jgi:hypothetical protein
MGKTIFAAVIAAILSSIATVLVMGTTQADKLAADADARKKDEDVRRVERERLERRVAELEKRPVPAPRAERRAADDASAPGVPPPPLAPDGTPYVSRAELEAFARKYAAAAMSTPTNFTPAKPVEKKSLEDIARDMNLSAGEEANLRNILRETEEEYVRCICGNRPLDEIKRDVKEAKDDPEKQAALIQGAVNNGIANVGKLMTLHKVQSKKIEAVLGAERAAKFEATPRKPVIDGDLDEVLNTFK